MVAVIEPTSAGPTASLLARLVSAQALRADLPERRFQFRVQIVVLLGELPGAGQGDGEPVLL